MIQYVNYDGGRMAAGYKGKNAGDCIVRALAILTGNDYKRVYMDVAHVNKIKGGKRSARDGVSDKVWKAIFADYDLVKIKLPPGPRPTYSEAYEQYGNCIVTTNRHACAIVNGTLRDTFDGRGYWWKNHVSNEPEWRERKARSVWVAA